MKILKTIFGIPTLPIKLLIGLIFAIFILINTGMVEFIIANEDEDYVKSKTKEILDKYYFINPILYALNTIGWVYVLIKLIKLL